MKKIGANKSIYGLISLLSLTLFLAVWWIYALQPSSFISTPKEVVERIIHMCYTPVAKTLLGGHILASLSRVLVAFAIACVIGVAMGIGFGWFKTFRRFVWPLFSIVRPIPPIAWIPLIILWCGIGEKSKIIIVFIAALMPVVLNTYAGIASADQLLLNAGTTLGANARQMLFNVALPDAVPTIIAGMKTSLSTAWLAVVAAEMVAATKGVGYLIINGMEELDIAQVMAGIVVIALISSILTFSLNKLERILCPWVYLNAK
ncbi:MAG: ABC transporter permease [Oscillospiraceae bacterium]